MDEPQVISYLYSHIYFLLLLLMGEVIQRVDRFRKKAELQGTARWLPQGFAPSNILIREIVKVTPRVLLDTLRHGIRSPHLPEVIKDRQIIPLEARRRTSAPTPA